MMKKTALCSIGSLLLLSPATVLAAQGVTPGRLEGTLTDSVRSAPLADAVVTTTRLDSAGATPLQTHSDRRGRYVFHGLPPGRYSVTFASALLDSLEFGITPVVATVPSGAPARADLATPSGATLRAAACPGAGLARWTGALLGVVVDAATGRPLNDATLTVTWAELAMDSSARDLAPRPRSARVGTSATGQYRLCGIPTDERLDVQIEHRGRSGQARSMIVPDAQGVLVRNLSFTAEPIRTGDRPALATDGSERSRPGTASVVGRITLPDGRPVVGAQVRVVNSVSAGRSDERGSYTLVGLPEGSHDLEVRRLGYGIMRRTVVLRSGQTIRENVIMERVVSLDSVNVVARPVRFAEFERNRVRYPGGIFMDEDEMARRGFRTLPLMVSSTRGFRLVALPRGRWGVKSVNQRRCQEFGGERLPALNLVVDNLEWVDFMEVQFPRVVAMEIYENGANAPWKYARACSVIVLWTRDVARSMRPPIDTATATIAEPKTTPKAAPVLPMPTF